MSQTAAAAAHRVDTCRGFKGTLSIRQRTVSLFLHRGSSGIHMSSCALLKMAAAGHLHSPSPATSSCSLGDALKRCRDAVAIHVAATPDCELVEMEDVLDGRRFDSLAELQQVLSRRSLVSLLSQ